MSMFEAVDDSAPVAKGPGFVVEEDSLLEREFLKRPSITIRARLIGAFVFLFLLMLPAALSRRRRTVPF